MSKKCFQDFFSETKNFISETGKAVFSDDLKDGRVLIFNSYAVGREFFVNFRIIYIIWFILYESFPLITAP